MRGLRLSSVVLGVVVDKAIAILTIGSLMAFFDATSQIFQNTALVAGFLATTVGAFVAGHHAKHRAVAHGVAVGLAAFVISFSRFALATYFSSPDSSAAHPFSWELIAWASVIAAGFAGGHIASRAIELRAAQQGAGS